MNDFEKCLKLVERSNENMKEIGEINSDIIRLITRDKFFSVSGMYVIDFKDSKWHDVDFSEVSNVFIKALIRKLQGKRVELTSELRNIGESISVSGAMRIKKVHTSDVFITQQEIDHKML